MYPGEKFNTISHLTGAILSMIGLVALMMVAYQQQSTRLALSFFIFGVSLVTLYTCSALYHSRPVSPLKNNLRKLDHIAIYLLIAGTYTPFTLVSLQANNGDLLLIFVWSMAAIGIVIDVMVKKRLELLQISIYLMMGWSCVIEVEALKIALQEQGFQWLLAGGLLYSFGVIFYVLGDKKRMKHGHGVWHVFVMLGSMSHFIAIIGYVR